MSGNSQFDFRREAQSRADRQKATDLQASGRIVRMNSDGTADVMMNDRIVRKDVVAVDPVASRPTLGMMVSFTAGGMTISSSEPQKQATLSDGSKLPVPPHAAKPMSPGVNPILWIGDEADGVGAFGSDARGKPVGDGPRPQVPDPKSVVDATTDVQVVWVEKGVIQRPFNHSDMVELVRADIRHEQRENGPDAALRVAGDWMTRLTIAIGEATEEARRDEG